MVVEVDAHTRYVIAKYFRPVDGVATRSRATRHQVRRFIEAALRTCVREQATDILDAREKVVARRLQTPQDDGPGVECLVEPRSKGFFDGSSL